MSTEPQRDDFWVCPDFHLRLQGVTGGKCWCGADLVRQAANR